MLPRHTGKERVLFQELYQLALGSCEYDLAHELGNAKLLDYLQQVNLCVEVAHPLVEDTLLL